MNLSTAKQAAKAAKQLLQEHPAAENSDLISSVMVKIKPNRIAKDVANDILQAYAKEGVHTIIAKNMISGISANLRGLRNYIFAFIGILWILAAAVLIIVFSVSINGRKREFSIFRVLGARKASLVKLILCEASLISLLGSVSGIAAAALIIFPFSTYIALRLGLPYLQPAYGDLFITALISFSISFASGSLASAWSAIKIGSSEIYSEMKDGE
jgi:putative ABC transport system permease protein